MTNLSLAPEHYADLQKSGLSDDSIREAGIKSVPPDQINKKLERNIPGLKSMYQIPYPNIYEYCRYKVFYEKGKERDRNGKEKPKYLQGKNTLARPYIHPMVSDIANKPNKPIWICEGEKKCLKLIQHGEYAIGLSGVWNFRAGKDSDLEDERDLWNDLKEIVWKGRTAYIAFDNDLWTNPQVRYALYEFTFQLYASGSIIKFICLS